MIRILIDRILPTLGPGPYESGPRMTQSARADPSKPGLP